MVTSSKTDSQRSNMTSGLLAKIFKHFAASQAIGAHARAQAGVCNMDMTVINATFPLDNLDHFEVFPFPATSYPHSTTLFTQTVHFSLTYIWCFILLVLLHRIQSIC